ncbi:50S ribosomal protein L25 [Tumebacillus algifaecis]|uniref:Large ribosomal subunit protein bL25 n=2 Tax=Tumebacillus algifaecis TaxID=1214604 RepID=A0A223D6W1_9BACL|nr:50S ribosomal protein L25 [Tumebacillus algifaecis]
MNRINLEAHPRLNMTKGERNSIRRRGDVPGVVYGKTREPQAIYITEESFKQLRGNGRTLVELTLDGDRISAMVHEVTRDIMNKKPLHIDLHAVNLAEPIHVEIPIFLDGLEAVEKKTNGIIQQQTREVLVKCLPTDVPQFILHNIAALSIGGSVTCGDLTMPSGVTMLSPTDEVVCSVIAAKNAPADTEIEPKEPELVHDTEGKGKNAADKVAR